MTQIFASIAPGVDLQREPVNLDDLKAAGVDLERDFPGSVIDDFRRYPVLSEGGWFVVIKHMPTMTSVSRIRWHLLGPIKLTSDGLSIE